MEGRQVEMASRDEIKASFTPDDVAAHAVTKELLWLMYPQDKNENSKPSADDKADEVATYIVEAIKNKRRAALG